MLLLESTLKTAFEQLARELAPRANGVASARLTTEVVANGSAERSGA